MKMQNCARQLAFLSIAIALLLAALLLRTDGLLPRALQAGSNWWSNPAAFAAQADSNALIGSHLQIPPGYHLTFEDDFNELSISDTDGNPARWYSQTIQCCLFDTSKPSTPTHMATLHAPGEQRPFTLVPGEGLSIELRKSHDQWYSGVLATVDHQGRGFAQQYGYFEMKAQFPDAPGTWPAFWLLNQAALTGGRSPVEIDVVESYMQFPSYINTTLHDWAPPARTIAEHQARVSDLSQGFHSFAMLWTHDVIEFACDGIIYYTTPTTESMRQPFYPIIDLGLGGGWPTDKTPPSSRLLVRSLKVYAQ
jgi:hypothetical protein